ncbi:MAG: methionyl-tRNA formyltransferase, partial [Calditrichaeota bacterium]
CFAILNGKSIKFLRSSCIPEEQTQEAPGSVVFVGKNGPLKVQTGDGIISLLELQPEGRKKMTAAEFICGSRIKTGDIFS